MRGMSGVRFPRITPRELFLKLVSPMHVTVRQLPLRLNLAELTTSGFVKSASDAAFSFPAALRGSWFERRGRRSWRGGCGAGMVTVAAVTSSRAAADAAAASRAVKVVVIPGQPSAEPQGEVTVIVVVVFVVRRFRTMQARAAVVF